MRTLPDPDSETMGFLVDQWLVSLRQAGGSSRQLQTAVGRPGFRIAKRNAEDSTRGTDRRTIYRVVAE